MLMAMFVDTADGFFREAAADCVYVQSLLMALFTKSNADSDESLQLIVYITFC
jgi:hypothetical protein